MRSARHIAVGVLLYGVLLSAAPLALAAPQRPSTQDLVSGKFQYGLASWYGRHWRGRKTASGAFFDDRALTAAHRTLPLGSRVQVTNLKTGRSVVVKITDRGPHVRHRVIDLSRAAAERLGFTHRGVMRVKLKVVDNKATAGADSESQQTPAAPLQER